MRARRTMPAPVRGALTPLRYALAAISSAAMLCLLSPVAASGHSASPVEALTEEERTRRDARLRSFENRLLGPAHARQHAVLRRSSRTAAGRARLARAQRQ